jgi:RNA polymerase sigma factor (sigma-70 family)
VQDSCLRALTYFESFHGGDGRAWLLAIVRHACYARLRKNRRAGAVFDSELDLELTPDRNPNPETLHFRNRDRLQVQRGLELLPAEFREVLILREMEGMSYKQIAAITETPIGTVMSRLARARRRLQEILAAPKKEEMA